MSRAHLPRRAAAPCAATLLALCCGTALATWSTVGSGTGEATTGTLRAPGDVRADGAGTVSWSRGATGDGAVPATHHEVQRSAVSQPDDGQRSWVTACSSTSTSCTDLTLPQEPGQYLVVYRVVARYAEAWSATSAESAVTTVTVEPDLTVSTPDLHPASDTGVSSSDDLTRLQVLTVTGTATAGALVEVLDGSTVVGSTTATATGAYSVTTAALSGGTGAAHPLSARATADGFTAVSGTLVVTVDTVAPVLGPVSVGANGNNSNGKPLSGTASTATTHPGALGTVSASVTDATPNAGCSVSAASVTVNQSTGAWSGTAVSLERGATCSATVTQSDTAGNTATATATVTRG